MKKATGNTVRLSPSTLGLFSECPRCFHRHMRGLRRPRGPFPSLCGGMDRALKRYADKHRPLESLPPELNGQVEGRLYPGQEAVDRWRNWRSGLRWFDPVSGAELSGALDDCILLERDGTKLHSPLDFQPEGRRRAPTCLPTTRSRWTYTGCCLRRTA